MLWILLDVALAMLAIGALVLACLRLWRTTKALGRAMSDAGDRVGAAMDRLPSLERHTNDT